MFSLKRTISAAAIVLVLAIVTGCKTSETKPTPVVTTVPSAGHTNTPPTLLPPPDTGDTMAPNVLAWDVVAEDYHAKPGELKAPFTFNVTNVFSGPVIIYDTSTTCDCTVASLPAKPWTLASGASGKIEATIDLTKKTNTVVNSIIVFTSQGNRRLNVKAYLPE